MPSLTCLLHLALLSLCFLTFNYHCYLSSVRLFSFVCLNSRLPVPVFLFCALLYLFVALVFLFTSPKLSFPFSFHLSLLSFSIIFIVLRFVVCVLFTFSFPFLSLSIRAYLHFPSSSFIFPLSSYLCCICSFYFSLPFLSFHLSSLLTFIFLYLYCISFVAAVLL